VGSTNLNLASWLNNYELDVAVENREFAERMAAMYEADLERSTEIVLRRRFGVRASPADDVAGRSRRALSGSAGRAAAGAVGVGAAVGAAFTHRRVLGPADAKVLWAATVVLIGLAVLAVAWPWAVAIPIGVLAGWLGVVSAIKALRLRRSGPAAAERGARRREA
jgi:cardiolipin synthase